MYESKLIKRDRSDLNSEYIYYQRKTQFLHHQVILVDVYLAFLRMPGKLLEFTPEVVMGDIRPDAKVIYDDGRYTHLILVEIHRSNAFNQQKYEDFYRTGAWKKFLPAFPKILVVSDRKISLAETKLPYYIVPNDLKGIERVIA